MDGPGRARMGGRSYLEQSHRPASVLHARCEDENDSSWRVDLSGALEASGLGARQRELAVASGLARSAMHPVSVRSRSEIPPPD